MTATLPTDYIGRFAPSPTGLLHIGSLLTALASYADARANRGKWLVRMEDLDPPREMPGAAAHILHTLEAFGFEWDGEVVWQSRRHSLYRDALGRLKEKGLLYPCYCSRKDWQAAAAQGADGFVYNGRCRRPEDRPHTDKPPAWRIRVNDETIGFDDGIVGHYAQNLARDIGDFVLLRADGFWAYQLAVVADDADQGITHIVRGQDLLVSTPRQIYLQRCLGFATPHYAHLPLLVNKHGQKWSKQTLAPALDENHKEQLLRQVLQYLNLPPAPEVSRPQALLSWAIEHWQPHKIPIHDIVTE
ncbi:MAG: tRNA glutamyl-Q(34) synthetase GluQRS [Neisseria sicca]|jgi:glutamyl-queuosine tRNA(asp) synthetase|uniref:Glutamyl-Q tRNA(Asp) synthetase n=2 Tax=Neisseria TaxID=482 RepID=A0A930DHR8_NEISI|nr:MULTISPECIES: tRNA glutamyl-Q(34) synthetase GluQRS [Neisseria]OFT18400.1 tRNA glutamyl-Q synthetase [Neisseria sp. HMSC03D10]OFV42093.1 tRNA glutamyl-Q synthetase [Neisseria sp. HMSC15C08]RKV75985.1 MAG: tRNA glutamyl-Q(34) synthetase GluQRS [Neisseria sp.]WNU98388.1 tRNA glutamyl-Q(34) synthetase GluQRS [Neisseria sp. DTU_2020_1000833_1_SI_GRL_NUU_006]ARC50257.1 tRNA glutamyl-Q(34) synthetase GluQRS [Neisseria mucosa]